MRIGITDYAQDALGDVVFVEVPEVGADGRARRAVDQRGRVTKSVSDIYAPVSGTIVEVNADLADSPRAAQRGPVRRGLDLRDRARPTRRSSTSCSTPTGYRALIEG